MSPRTTGCAAICMVPAKRSGPPARCRRPKTGLRYLDRWAWRQPPAKRPTMGAETIRGAEGFVFRDRNKNGRLDPYEDPRRPIEERVEDFLAQMTLEEKAGMLFQRTIDV